MSGSFDPYHKWLAIPPEELPPNYYRLLALPLYESDPDVIDNAADQRMLLLRSFQAGKNAALSQQILNEVSAARVCLLNPEKRAKYDARLLHELAGSREKRSGSPTLAERQTPSPPLPPPSVPSTHVPSHSYPEQYTSPWQSGECDRSINTRNDGSQRPIREKPSGPWRDTPPRDDCAQPFGQPSLRIANVEELEVTYADGVMTVRWDWPADIDTCFVALRSDQFPLGPRDKQAHVELFGRYQYDSQGGFRYRVPPHGRIYLIVYSRLKEQDRCFWATGETSRCRKIICLGGYRKISYRITPTPPFVTSARDSEYKLVITPSDDTRLPELVLVGKDNGLPLSPSNGMVLLRVRAGTFCTPDQPYVTHFRPKDLSRHWDAKLFSADERHYEWLELLRDS